MEPFCSLSPCPFVMLTHASRLNSVMIVLRRPLSAEALSYRLHEAPQELGWRVHFTQLRLKGKLDPPVPSLQLPHRLTHASLLAAFNALFIILKSPEDITALN